VTTSELINEVAAACAKAQMELVPALKDAKNPHYNSTYADLAAVIQATKVYAKHAVAIWQDVTTSVEGVSVTTRLAHASGQWVEFGPITVPMGKRDAHGVGSATTYAKRFALQAAALVPSEDDDGNAASTPREEPKFKPVGYDDWAKGLEATLAEAGREAAAEDFKASKPEFRDYFTKHDTARYAKFKAAKKAA
jgi:hypothetical protein